MERPMMFPRDVKAPTVPIPFHKLLTIVAIVDDKNPQIKQLLDQGCHLNRIDIADHGDHRIGRH